jgi:hypothetical protein
MRAVCETCGAAQPVDWKAGDLCGSCGSAVRRDIRCFWCAKGTPAGKFCRSCAAALVEETLYGAARMLKEAGTDRFTIPKLLGELDREQVENFTRIYQRHAVAVARHVDEVRFIERFLVQRGWSAPLEDELTAQLPWPDATLAAMSGAPLPTGGDLATVTAIAKSSPLSATRALAALARVRLDDWTACREAAALLASRDPLVRREAALVLSGWRVRYGIEDREEAEALPGPRPLLDELRQAPASSAVAVRIALLTGDPEGVPPEAVGHPDPEIAFTAALVSGDVDRLGAALSGGPLERIAAGTRLAELGALAPLEAPLRSGPPEVQRRLLAALVSRRAPAGPLADVLTGLLETTDDGDLREQAARVLCRTLRPDLALRVLRAAKESHTIFQLLLLPAAGLPEETAGRIVEEMVEGRTFRASQFGLEGAAERGAIPDALVPRLFAAAGDETRLELLGLAEMQLKARGDEALHRFVMNVVFGPHAAKTRAAAWWALRRWYLRSDVRGEGPFRLTQEGIERFFGSAGAFVPRLTALVRDGATLAEGGIVEALANLFASTDAGDAALLAAAGEPARDLVRALLEALRPGLPPLLADGAFHLLGLLGTDPRWRGEVIEGLEAIGRTGNFHWETALRSTRESALPGDPG